MTGELREGQRVVVTERDVPAKGVLVVVGVSTIDKHPKQEIRKTYVALHFYGRDPATVSAARREAVKVLRGVASTLSERFGDPTVPIRVDRKDIE